MTIRPIKDPGRVRLGVRGSLSATSSATAKNERMTTTTVDPIKEKGEPWSSSQPSQAAQLTAAGAVRERNPATSPMPMARAKTYVEGPVIAIPNRPLEFP
jgi:hypothetical protein